MGSSALISFLRQHFVLDWRGIHGAPHWSRVRLNGMRLAATTGANLRVVEAFALLHDSCRLDDNYDPDHGSRAAVLAQKINSQYLGLDDLELKLLSAACEGHSAGRLKGDITVQTCWDADRLDLGRVGIRPVASRLCTLAARDQTMIAWAFARSQAKKTEDLAHSSISLRASVFGNDQVKKP